MKVSDFGLPVNLPGPSSAPFQVPAAAFDPDSFVPLLEGIPFFPGLTSEQQRSFVEYLRRKGLLAQVAFDYRGYENLLELIQAARHFQTSQALVKFLEEVDMSSYLPLLVPESRARFDAWVQQWMESQLETEAGEERAYTCNRCKRNRFMDLQLQLRSADEGATIITKCTYCGAIRKKE